MQALADDGDQHIDRDRNPDWGLHGVLRGAEEAVDSQMLFDPSEQEFDLPARPVERGKGQGRQLPRVRQKDERLGGRGVLVANPPQVSWIALAGIEPLEQDGLVADESRGPVDRM